MLEIVWLEEVVLDGVGIGASDLVRWPHHSSAQRRSRAIFENHIRIEIVVLFWLILPLIST